ncbi:MAG TPA: thioredoxin domain-containing protein [Pyrinomonadaceae bacterium]|nr:thioredoxin domain-containing protein [Pyrinomonadaceae bacterium]
MKTFRPVCLLIVVSFLNASATAQTTRRQRPARRAATRPEPAASPVPTPSPTPVRPRVPSAPVVLATVNGENVTTAEIDPEVREQVETLDDKINDTRRQILELQINTILLDTEAARRKMTGQQLYDFEVKRKLTPPTDAEINKFIEDNRASIQETDPATLKKDVAGYLLGEKETRLSGELVDRLRAATPIVKGVDVNATNVAPATVVVTVAGKPITFAMIEERSRPIIYKLRSSTYLLEKDSLDRAINNMLLLAEARRRNVPPEDIMRTEVSEKAHTPTEAEIAKFYSENQRNIPQPLDAVRIQISSYLLEQQQREAEAELALRLRKAANVRILISEPAPLVQTISVDDDPFRGDVNAPVTIVEFTDFQCPSCAAMQPVLDDVLKSYGNKVRFVVRDFPLLAHANARKAAEAANAANAQGKFFEYTQILFKHQSALDVPSLKKYASDLGLNRAQFDTALDSGRFADEVRHDLADGEKYGVDSTPTIFINGVALTELSSEGLRAAIDKALASGPQKASAQ